MFNSFVKCLLLASELKASEVTKVETGYIYKNRITFLALPCSLSVLTTQSVQQNLHPFCVLSAAGLKCSSPTSPGKWHEGSTLSCKSDCQFWEDLTSKHLTLFTFKLRDSQSPLAPGLNLENYFYIFHNLDRRVDLEHASGMSNSISPSASKSDWDYLLGSVPKEWLTPNQLVQIKMLFLRV